MRNKINKVIRYILTIAAVICMVSYVYQRSANTEVYQQKVVARFMNTFYDGDYSYHKADDEYSEALNSLLSGDYVLELTELDYIMEYPTGKDEKYINYNGYTISKVFKEKVDGKKVTVHNVDVEFLDDKENLTYKGLYIELLNENSEWKINKIMPRFL